MEKVYPIDIAGIKNIGVEEWLENYYVPVTGKEFKDIYDKVFKTYLDIISQNDNGIICWIAIPNIRIPYYVSLYILDLLKFIRLREKGYDCIVGQKKEEIPEDISAYEFTDLSNINLVGKIMSGLTPQERAKNILRTIKYNIKSLALHGVGFIRNISNPYYFVGNRGLQEVVSFCDEKNIVPVCLSLMLFTKNSNNHYDTYFKASGLIEFVNDFLDVVRKQHTIVNDLVFECLKKEINEILRVNYSFFCQNVEVFSKFKPKKLIVTSLGNPIHRIFCSAWRYAGGEVIVISHGNTYSNHYCNRLGIELSVVDLFVSSSRGHKEILRQAVNDFSLELKNCKITYGENNAYKSLYGRLQSVSPVNKIKKIMVVGAVIENYCEVDTEYHTYSFLYNDIQMIKILKKAGYYTIYKPRPETMHETYGIFEMYADDVLKEKLEDVYKNADCLVFSSPYSTAFGFSLLTNRPIVLFNVKGYLWYSRAFELIKKRCRIVEAYPADGRIVFDENGFIDAVESSLGNINYDVLYEFAF